MLPEPQADPTRFYVLATPMGGSAPVESATPASDLPVVHLRPVELASYLRGRPMILRRGDNEIEFREFARWGEPLELGIARVLREELAAGGAARVQFAAGSRRAQSASERTLTVRVLAAEGGAEGTVAFRAIWELSAKEATATAGARGDYRPADLRWDAKTDASLAAVLSEAVAGLAREISAAFKR